MLEFFKCKHCGQIIKKIKDTGVGVICCGEKMELVTPNTTDASLEKHVPVVEVNDGVAIATVGSTEHPMIKEHFIEWIILETNQGSYKMILKPDDKPTAKFNLREGEVVLHCYAYCNLHGLWMNK